MKLIDFVNESSQVRMVDPAAVTATGTLGQSVDLQGFQGRVLLLIALGAVTGTTPTLDLKVQDSADNSSFADATTAITLAQLVTASAAKVFALAVDVRSVRRYINLYGTAGGTTPSFTMSVAVVGQKQII